MIKPYNEYLSQIAEQNDGWWFLTIPIIGWAFAVLAFGIYFPLKYFWNNGDES